MKSLRFRRYIASVMALSLVFVTIFLVFADNVSAQTPTNVNNSFVEWTTQTRKDPTQIVTYEGGNTKGAIGTGKQVNDASVVPTCVGKKGSASNPFVVLEVVANHADQQLVYLGQEDDATYSDVYSSSDPNEIIPVLDMMQIGIDRSRAQNRTFRTDAGDHISTGSDYLAITGSQNWFNSYEYNSYIPDGSGDVEKLHYAVVDKLYSLKITEADLINAGIDLEEFSKTFDSTKYTSSVTNDNNRNLYRIADIANKYPALFDKDDNGKAIRQIALDDPNNWDIVFKKNIISPAEDIRYSGTGYLVAVEPGQGDFGFASEDDAKNWIFTKTGTDYDRWKFYENESDIPEKYRHFGDNDNAGLYKGGFYIKSLHIPWTEDIGKLYTEYGTDAGISGLTLDMSHGSNNGLVLTHVIKPEVAEYVYSFDYYGLKNNNILKRQLFDFKSRKEYDDFKIKVIVMTPDEINENLKSDTEQTIDIIERADMFYVGGYGSGTDAIRDVHNLYNNFAKNKVSVNDQSKTFKTNDMDWLGCYKMIYRLCTVNTLPLINTAELGNYWTDSYRDAVVKMPRDEDGDKSVERNSTINNMAKLYLVTMQFNLTARKSSKSVEYKRTFYEDILMKSMSMGSGWLGSIDRINKSTTGYYEKNPLAKADADNQADYLWNPMTFLTPELDDIWSNDDQIKTDKDTIDKLISYGYSKFYFKGDTPSKIFSNGDQNAKTYGSDGIEGNVGLVGGGANTNFSTLLGATPSAGVDNVIMDIAHEILISNNADDLSIVVLPQVKEYVKLSDLFVMIDHSKDEEFDESQESYVLVKISTAESGAALDGVVEKVEFVDTTYDTEMNKKEGATPRKVINLYDKVLEQNKTDGESTVWRAPDEATFADSNRTVSGYVVKKGSPLIIKIPYSLLKWADGFKYIELTTTGRAYGSRQHANISSESAVTDISIEERELFPLE